MHGVFHLNSSTARVHTRRKNGEKNLYSIGHAVRQKEQRLKSNVGREADSDPLLA